MFKILSKFDLRLCMIKECLWLNASFNLKRNTVTCAIFFYKSYKQFLIAQQGSYYLLTSGCTGWDPNEALYAVSDSMLGEWKEMGNPCVGEQGETTFNSQSTFLLPLGVDGDQFVFMADRWNKTNIEDSRYVWLPGAFRGHQMEITWRDQWTPEVAKGRTTK